jgi:hypothetical protein
MNLLVVTLGLRDRNKPEATDVKTALVRVKPLDHWSVQIRQ